MAASTTIARNNAGKCVRIEGASPAADSAISGSVGQGGANRPDDVRTVQRLLNDVDPSGGGPAVPLNVDGLVGPLTLKAIAHFQQTNLGFNDSRVDPNGPTLRALNANENGSTSVGARGGSSVAAPSRPRRPRFVPNPGIPALIDSLVPEVRRNIRAAQFHLTLVQPFVTTHKQTLPQGPFLSNARFSLRLLDAVFSFFKFKNPQVVHNKLRNVYFNMEVAMRLAFDLPEPIAKRVIVPNQFASMDNFSGFTNFNGAFAKDNERGALGEHKNLIFICNNVFQDVRNEQINTIVHELAHFVGFGRGGGHIDDVVAGRFATSTALLNSLSPSQKIRNAEHYAAYAFFCKENALPG